jgi:hypothetical protein
MNKACHDLIGCEIEGNIIPQHWCKYIRINSRPDLVGIMIFADIVYWHRPVKILKEQDNELIEYRQKFKADKLQKSYSNYSEMLGVSKKVIKASIDNLVEQGFLTREFRTVVSNNTPYYNVMFLEPIIAKIKEIETLFINRVPPPSQKGTTPSLPKGNHPPTNSAPPHAQKGDTYTENTTENIRKEGEEIFPNEKISLSPLNNQKEEIGSEESLKEDKAGIEEENMFAPPAESDKGSHNNILEKDKQGERGKKSREKKGPDFIDQLLEIFGQVYHATRSHPYYIANKNKERAIMAKLLKEWKNGHPGRNSEETLRGMREFFKFAAGVTEEQDKWIHKNFSLAIINTGINTLRELAKNRRNKFVPIEQKKEEDLTETDKLIIKAREKYAEGYRAEITGGDANHWIE